MSTWVEISSGAAVPDHSCAAVYLNLAGHKHTVSVQTPVVVLTKMLCVEQKLSLSSRLLSRPYLKFHGR